MFWIITTILLALLSGTLGWTAWNNLRKNERLEDYLVEAFERAQLLLDHIQAIDRLGAFEADDEVGQTFEMIKGSIEEYADFLGVEVELE
jgi:hypothetical protein